MPINDQDKLNLVIDILNSHQTDACGSISECEQLGRVVKSLLAKPNQDYSMQGLLEEIYKYSQDGISSSQLDDHIESHQHNLSHWVTNISQFS